MEVNLNRISEYGFEVSRGDVTVGVSFHTNAWTYRFYVRLNRQYGLYCEHSDTVDRLVNSLLSGDRWSMAVFELASLFNYRTSKEHIELMFNGDSLDKRVSERRLLNGLWISVMLKEDVSMAKEVLSIMRKYADVLDEKLYRDYARRFSEVETHIIAKRLRGK